MYAQIEKEAEKIMASIGLIRSSLVLGPIAIFCHNTCQSDMSGTYPSLRNYRKFHFSSSDSPLCVCVCVHVCVWINICPFWHIQGSSPYIYMVYGTSSALECCLSPFVSEKLSCHRYCTRKLAHLQTTSRKVGWY